MRSPIRTVVVDTETTGLNPAVHQVTEVAWHDMSTGQSGYMITPHILDNAEPEALSLSGYHERIAGQRHATQNELRFLWDVLGGDGVETTLAGFNPRFDSAMLEALFAREGFGRPTPWRHRLLDVAVLTYAFAPTLLDGQTPSLAEAAALAGVVNDLPHSAAADVATTVAVLEWAEALRVPRG